MDLELYLIPPPWHEDLCKRFPEYIQREIAQRASPIGLGNHHEYGFFALETTGQGPIILWMEVDPERKIITPKVSVPQPARDPRGYLVDWVQFCPCCGAGLRVVTPDDEDWGDFCGMYRVKHGTEWFLCTGERRVEVKLLENKSPIAAVEETDCVYKDIPLVLHNPARGWDEPPGDNWAIGYVK